MSQFKVWNVSVDGTDYLVKAGRANAFKSFVLTVNDRPVALPNPFFGIFTGTDAVIKLGSKEAHFVMIGKKMDLAIDGVYLESHLPYQPFSKIPVWAWIFVAGYVPMFIMGGAISYLLALLGVIYTLRTMTAPNKKDMTKVLTAIGLEVGIWIVYIIVVFIFALLIGTE